MSYSDYGAYVWSRPRALPPPDIDDWHFCPQSIDVSVKMFLEGIPPPVDRPLEELTGMKFDVLLAAQSNFADGEGDWQLEHAHHAVFGDGTVVVSCHKQSMAAVFINGQECKVPPKRVKGWEEGDYLAYRGAEIEAAMPHGYSMKLKYVCPGIVVYLLTPEEEWLAYSGYGLGGHWWMDEEGNELDYDTGETMPGARQYPREKEALGVALRALGEKCNT